MYDLILWSDRLTTAAMNTRTVSRVLSSHVILSRIQKYLLLHNSAIWRIYVAYETKT